MKLKRLKLSDLSDKSLKDKEMNALRGGNCCTCSCYWEDRGGSSSMDNLDANHSSYTSSVDGCNQYGWCGEGVEGQYYDGTAHA